MTLLNALNSVSRTAIMTLRGLRSSRAGSTSLQFAFLLCLVSLGACSELTSPQRAMNRAAVDSVMPSVTDARVRLANGIKSIAVRQKVLLDLSALEIALQSDNVDHAHANIQAVSAVLDGYRTQSSVGDGADLSAIFLMLNAVSAVVDAGSAVAQ